MGIKGLQQKLIKTLKKEKHSGSLSTFSGKTVGVDISIWINQAIRNSISGSNIARMLNSDPPQDVARLIFEYLDSKLVILGKLNISIILVFDGARNPLKKVENEKRRKEAEEAELQLKSYWSNTDSVFCHKTLLRMVRKNVMASGYTTFVAKEWAIKRKIKYCSAPIEAEWQLVALEEQGIVDAIITSDTDTFVLGAKTVITDFASSKISDDKCTIWHQLEIMNGLKQIQNLSAEVNLSAEERLSIIKYAVNLGCDYFEKSSNETVLDYAVQQFLFPSVFVVKANDNEDTCRDAFVRNNFSIVFKSLNTITREFQDLKDVGYSPESCLALRKDGNLSSAIKEAFEMIYWVRDGVQLETHALPLPLSEDGKEVQHGSIINFKHTPIKLHFTETLVKWLEFRGFKFRAKAASNRKLILRMTAHVFEHRRSYPIFFTQIYSSPEIIPAQSHVWEKNTTTVEQIICELMPKIDKAWLLKNFGIRNQVRQRAVKLITGGHCCYDTLKVNGNLSIKEKIGCIISMDVWASQKADKYSIYIIFMLDTMEFVPAPAGSRCECPAGQLFCAHMLSIVLMIAMIQFFKDKGGITDLFQKLPEPIRMLQNFPISHSLIWNNKMKEGKRLVGISKQFIRPKKENIHNSFVGDEEYTELLETLDLSENAEAYDVFEIFDSFKDEEGEKRKRPIMKCLTTESINEDNKKIKLQRDQGSDSENKFRQLKLLQRLNEGFKKGDIKKNMLSFYLKETERYKWSLLENWKKRTTLISKKKNTPPVSLKFRLDGK